MPQTVAQSIARPRRCPIATIRDVAERANVSTTTVSHVINGTRRVSEDLRLRVHQAMQELGYRPNILARSLRVKRTHTIGLVIPDSANPFFAETARGMEDASFELGFSTILCNTDGDLEKELTYTEVLSEKQVDGIVFVAAGMSTEHVRALQARRIPLVVVDRDVPGVQADMVLTDNERGGWLATRHLLDLNHRRIGCITGPSEVTPSAERCAGYRRALREADIPFDEQLAVRGDFRYESGYQATRWLLALPDPPTAIFANNDMMAIGAIRAAAEHGLHIPTQLSIVGFDDVELASYVVPPLTTVSQPKYQMGATAAKLLVERIHDYDAPTRRVLLRTELAVRDSTAPPHREASAPTE